MLTPPCTQGAASRLPLADRLALARARLVRRHGNLWRAAAACSHGRSAGWLAARLSGRTAFDLQFVQWIETECGIDIVDGFSSEPPAPLAAILSPSGTSTITTNNKRYKHHE